MGCERSRQIHAAFYGARAERAGRLLPARLDAGGGGPTLLKCCLLERGIERDGERLAVPWGATLDEVRAGAAPARRHDSDSVVYGHLWGTPETRALFSDAGRTRIWLDIIAALAAEQAELGLIPAAAARADRAAAASPTSKPSASRRARRGTRRSG